MHVYCFSQFVFHDLYQQISIELTLFDVEMNVFLCFGARVFEVVVVIPTFILLIKWCVSGRYYRWYHI